MIPFRNPGEILGRLEFAAAAHPLLVGVPAELEAMMSRAGDGSDAPVSVGADAIRSVKDRFDFILLWREDRVGSQAALEGARKRLLPGGRLWVATALKKVQGPRVSGAHRLGLEDISKAFAKDGLSCDREVRLSAWHVAYRFVQPESAGAGER